MKKVIRLTEGDIVRLVKRVINEEDNKQVNVSKFNQKFNKLRDAIKTLFKQTGAKNIEKNPGLESYDAAKESKYGREIETNVESITYSLMESVGTEESSIFLCLSKLTGTYTKKEARTITNSVMFEFNDSEYTYYVNRYYLNNKLTDLLGQTMKNGVILNEVNTFDGDSNLQYDVPDEMRNLILTAFKNTDKYNDIQNIINNI